MYAAIPTPIDTCRPCCTEDQCDDPVVDAPVAIVNVATVADMAATVPYSGLRLFAVGGYLVEGDGQGGFWAYLPASTDTDDGYQTITPPNGVGRYVKWV